MRIRAAIANGYRTIDELKQTHIMKHDGPVLMHQLMTIGQTYQLSPEATFGYVIYRLKPYPIQYVPTNKRQPIEVSYTDADPNVAKWYQTSALSANQLSTQFVLTWLRLADTYGNSLAELLFLLQQVNADPNFTPVVPKFTPMVSVTPTTANNDQARPVAAIKPVKSTGFKITKAPKPRTVKSTPSKPVESNSELLARMDKLAQQQAAFKKQQQHDSLAAQFGIDELAHPTTQVTSSVSETSDDSKKPASTTVDETKSSSASVESENTASASVESETTKSAKVESETTESAKVESAKSNASAESNEDQAAVTSTTDDAATVVTTNPLLGAFFNRNDL